MSNLMDKIMRSMKPIKVEISDNAPDWNCPKCDEYLKITGFESFKKGIKVYRECDNCGYELITIYMAKMKKEGKTLNVILENDNTITIQQIDIKTMEKYDTKYYMVRENDKKG